jgi:hypothetical protein
LQPGQVTVVTNSHDVLLFLSSQTHMHIGYRISK